MNINSNLNVHEDIGPPTLLPLSALALPGFMGKWAFLVVGLLALLLFGRFVRNRQKQTAGQQLHFMGLRRAAFGFLLTAFAFWVSPVSIIERQMLACAVGIVIGVVLGLLETRHLKEKPQLIMQVLRDQTKGKQGLPAFLAPVLVTCVLLVGWVALLGTQSFLGIMSRIGGILLLIWACISSAILASGLYLSIWARVGSGSQGQLGDLTASGGPR